MFQENTPVKVAKDSSKDGPIESVALDVESQVAVEKDLVSQAEEEDIEALLGK
jgi:exocyst complex component 1